MTELNPKDQKPGYSNDCFCNKCKDLQFEAIMKLQKYFVLAGAELAYEDPFGDLSTKKICDFPVTDFMYSLQYFFLYGYVDALHDILLSGDSKKYCKLEKAIRAKRKNKKLASCDKNKE